MIIATIVPLTTVKNTAVIGKPTTQYTRRVSEWPEGKGQNFQFVWCDKYHSPYHLQKELWNIVTQANHLHMHINFMSDCQVKIVILLIL